MREEENIKEITEWIVEATEGGALHRATVHRVALPLGFPRKHKVIGCIVTSKQMFAAGYCAGIMISDFEKDKDEKSLYMVKIKYESANGMKESNKHFEYGGSAHREVLEERELYDIVKWVDPDYLDGLEMVGAFNKNGDYIGNVKMAELLCDEKGIAPILRMPDSSVCTIGFCAREDKWYGWSHRAIAGFGIGDKIYDEHFNDDKAKPQDHGFASIENLDDAEFSAGRYADSVS